MFESDTGPQATPLSCFGGAWEQDRQASGRPLGTFSCHCFLTMEFKRPGVLFKAS